MIPLAIIVARAARAVVSCRAPFRLCSRDACRIDPSPWRAGPTRAAAAVPGAEQRPTRDAAEALSYERAFVLQTWAGPAPDPARHQIPNGLSKFASSGPALRRSRIEADPLLELGAPFPELGGR